MSWSRIPGPPKVWSNVKLVNSDGKLFEFSIEDIPKDRYDEVLDYMCTSFVQEETMLSSINIIKDKESIEVLRNLWIMALNQGMSIAAFEKNDKNEKLKFAGLNVLIVVDDESDKLFKSQDISKLKHKDFFDFTFNILDEADPRNEFNVDKYLGAFGLYVLPQYRCLGLAKRLLETRNNIGQFYNLTVTETMFTSIIAQNVASSVGFITSIDRLYDDIINKNGKKLFPLLSGKRIKLMRKQLL